MLEPGLKQQAVLIPYLEGVNSLVSFNTAKKTEFVHAENARSKIIGTIEKREGQTVLGTNTTGLPFVTAANYGLFSFQNIQNQGLYRISVNESASISINVVDRVYIPDLILTEFTTAPTTQLFPLTIIVTDGVQYSEQVNENTGTLATIYYINSANQWVPLTGSGTGIPGGTFDYTYAEGCVFLVNFNSDNRYVTATGTTVVSATSASGHLYNTPPASRINFYKNRLYLADFVRDGVRYKTTILRSSYPMGIISLVNLDANITMSNINIGSTGTGDVDITDNKYFYTASGANVYEIYRATTKIAEMTVTAIQEVSVTASFVSFVATPVIVPGVIPTLVLLASDEIWIKGTYTGPKVFRWVSNPTITGRDIKQYDTFKLSGGENDAITMLTNIGNIMMVSNGSNMTTWNDYTLENFDLDIGCVSKKGYVKMIGTLYFIHYTGIYATSGTTPKLISNKIERYINGATKAGKENSAAGKKGRNIFFTLGDVTLLRPDGSLEKILKDVCVEYNLIQENWYIHKNVKASEFATFIENTDSDRLEFTDTAGNKAVKEFLNGESDDGDNIDFRVDTMKITMQPSFERSNNPIAILSEVERGAAIQAWVNLENEEEYYPLEGTMVKGLSVIKVTDKDDSRGKPPICRLMSISLRDSSKQRCKLNRITLIYVPLTDEIPNSE